MGYKPLRPGERFKRRWAIIPETFLDDYSLPRRLRQNIPLEPLMDRRTVPAEGCQGLAAEISDAGTSSGLKGGC